MNMTMAIVTMILPIIVTMTAIKATVTMINDVVMVTVSFCMIMIESSLSASLKSLQLKVDAEWGDSTIFCSNYYTELLH